MVAVGTEKVTWMKLTTKPLDDKKNYNKVKKALFKSPQVRDQVFDEKSNNTVIIKVVCCSPEDVMTKLCKEGRGAITTIDDGIDQTNPLAQKPKPDEKPKEAAPMVGFPVSHNGPYSDWRHPNGYYERPIYDSYGGGPPPSYYQEGSPCSIM